MASKTARNGKKQAQNHGERLFLKKNLSSILGELGALIVREEAVRLAQKSSSVPEFVRAVAGALEGTQGQESTYSVRILGTLSDLALKRMSWAEKQAPLESPREIVEWFAKYLERTLSQAELVLREGADAKSSSPSPQPSPEVEERSGSRFFVQEGPVLSG